MKSSSIYWEICFFILLVKEGLLDWWLGLIAGKHRAQWAKHNNFDHVCSKLHSTTFLSSNPRESAAKILAPLGMNETTLLDVLRVRRNWVRSKSSVKPTLRLWFETGWRSTPPGAQRQLAVSHKSSLEFDDWLGSVWASHKKGATTYCKSNTQLAFCDD